MEIYSSGTRLDEGRAKEKGYSNGIAINARARAKYCAAVAFGVLRGMALIFRVFRGQCNQVGVRAALGERLKFNRDV